MPKREIIGIGLMLLVIICGALQAQGVFDVVDYRLAKAAGDLRSDTGAALTPLFSALSRATDSSGRLIMLALLALAYFWRGKARRWLWLGGVSVAAMLLNSALKLIFQAERPDLMPHLDTTLSYSFPSGHACGNMVFFGALAMLSGSRFAWSAAIPVIVMIGISRVWLGVHWPSDVVCGWIEGIAILMLSRRWLPTERGH